MNNSVSPDDTELNEDAVIAALYKAKGLVAVAARSLRCSRTTVYSYMARSKRVDDAAKQARAEVVDVAEAKLFQAMNEGKPWAISMVLHNLGRTRGYGPQALTTAEAIVDAIDRLEPGEAERLAAQLAAALSEEGQERLAN